MALKDDLKTNRYRNPSAYNANNGSPLYWVPDGTSISDDMRTLAEAITTSGNVASVTGTAVDNTDPLNPIVLADMEAATYDPAGLASQITVASISQTVAQMQALAAGSDLIPGQTYLITDAAVAQGTCALAIKAYSTTRLEGTGFGSFENVAMAAAVLAEMDYDLANDILTRVTTVYDDAATALPVTVIDKGNGAIAAFPFDDTTNFQNCYFIDPTILNIAGQMLNVTLGDGCSIDLQGASIMINVNAGAGNGFALSGAAAIMSATIGCSNVFTFPGGQIFDKAQIGDSKEIDLTAFAAAITFSNVVYVGNYSNIVADRNTITNTADLSEAGGTLNMNSYKCAGLVYLEEPGTGTLATISNFPTDHIIELRSSYMTVLDQLIDTGAGNLFLAGALDTTLNFATDDWISFRLSDANPANLIQVDSQIYQ